MVFCSPEHPFIFSHGPCMELILIAAMAANRVIGRNNGIPWQIPGEQQRFRAVTWGHTLLMGRRTHESIGRPLPGRRNIVVSRNPAYRAEGCEVASSLEEAYALCGSAEKVFNIGGEELYRQGLAQADTLILTVLREEWDGDAFFPAFSPADFQLVAEEKVSGSTPYVIRTYRKRKR